MKNIVLALMGLAVMTTAVPAQASIFDKIGHAFERAFTEIGEGIKDGAEKAPIIGPGVVFDSHKLGEDQKAALERSNEDGSRKDG